MIFVERDSVDEQGIPIRPNDDWFASASKATKKAIAEGGDHKASDTIYAHAEVRKALEKLFNSKCVYCERQPGSAWDVEHFRPKGRVAESEHHPGYYWLAYEWTNLYMACTHCNRSRKDKPLWDEPKELPAAGKRDQFPLEDETTRAMSHHGDADDEMTLLIDPCCDDPADYLGFDVQGDIFSLEDNPFGEESIRVFNLKRRRLKNPRRKAIAAAMLVFGAIKKAQANGQDEAVADFRLVLDSYQADDSPFAAAARYVELDPTAFGIS